MRTLSERAVQAELRRVRPIDTGSAGSRRISYLNLHDEDFERLLYSLAKARRKTDEFYNRVHLALAGGDAGMDVSLWKDEQLVGVMQCKRRSYRLPLPEALIEVLKFLLFLALDGEMPPAEQGFRYCLVLAKDPARTTDAFFKRPRSWIEANGESIDTIVGTVLKEYASLTRAGVDEVLPAVLTRMATIDYHLLRPADLDEWLDDSPRVRQRFFRTDQAASRRSATTPMS